MACRMPGVGLVTVSERRSTTSSRALSVIRSPPAQHLRDEEGDLQCLLVVQPRVAQRLVAGGEVGLVDVLRAAEALGHVVPGQLQVQAARDGPEGLVHLEEALYLVEDVPEAAGLVAGRGLERVAVHGIADPQDVSAG